MNLRSKEHQTSNFKPQTSKPQTLDIELPALKSQPETSKHSKLFGGTIW